METGDMACFVAFVTLMIAIHIVLGVVIKYIDSKLPGCT
jgi:hypothetical protein